MARPKSISPPEPRTPSQSSKEDGSYVTCPSRLPEMSISYPRTVSRAVCLAGKMVDCPTCQHYRFTMFIKPALGDQVVACPRWNTEKEKLEGYGPGQYVMIRRETCLGPRPFPWCPSCLNSRPTSPPMSEVGWYDREKGRKKLPVVSRWEDDPNPQPG